MIDPTDRGFTLGDGAFETMRAGNGKIFRVEAHLGRLERALGKLRIPIPSGLEERLLAAAGDGGARALRLTVTRGPAPQGLMPPSDPTPTVTLVDGPIPPPPPELAARIVSGRKNEKAAGAGLKLLGYAEGILALLEARDAGDQEALLLDTEGHLSEASASNLFLVRGDELLTPPRSCGILPGVTRDIVFELVPRVREAILLPRDLMEADEAFLTSTLRGIVPLVRVDGRPVGDGRPGPRTQRLAASLRAVVERELGEAGPTDA